MEKVLTSLIYSRSLILVPHPQNWVSEVPQLSNPFIFGHLVVLKVIFAWFGCNQIYEIPQLSNLFILGLSTVLEGGFHIMWWWVTHARYGWWWVPRVMWLPSFSLLLLCHTSQSCSCRIALHAPSQELVAVHSSLSTARARRVGRRS
jgi:hypothetical protein